MASERNRIIDCINYLESLGITVNVGKNKARGNKGIFMHNADNFRIDIRKLETEKEILSVLIHEFSHYIHFLHDKTLKSLEFAFGEYSEDIHEELINVTVQSLPKKYAKQLFKEKESADSDIKAQAKILKSKFADFKISKPYKKIESTFTVPANYLLKYDKIKYFNKIYSITNAVNDFPELTREQIAYMELRSKQRKLKRINSRISKLNRYYNNPSELFSRFMEMYVLDNEHLKNIAPSAFFKFIEMNNKSNSNYLMKLNEFVKLAIN